MAANSLRGEAELVVGATAYKLAFDPNAFVYAEDAYGARTDRIIADLDDSTDGVNMKLIRALLWAGLQKHHACSQSDAGDIIADGGMAAVSVAVHKGIRAALGVTEDKKPADPPRRAKRGTG